MNFRETRKVMRSFVPQCTDRITGELNMTKLAEETCCELNLYVGDEIPEELFELAFELSNELSRSS